MPKSSSKSERILDAAEALFAIHGYDGVTMRQIASRADVDVALANYHFGRKIDVFNAVFERRAELLNSSRLSALREYQRQAGTEGPSVEQIVEAFLRPLKMALGAADEGWTNYLALIAYVNNSPVWGKSMMSSLFDELVSEFIAALKQALPQAREEDIYWCYQNLSGALTLTFAQTGRIDKLSNGKCRSDDLEAAYTAMIPFMAAGFTRVCG
ncbi:TetR family transcriptional regulator [Arenicella chitinivorans]|uniref:TetR family transcriptional regulator n=1 Tax=Arenicella chitinivorans TaxID=1329800 RepID=A0A918RGE0_9GAMM|nr:TetR/AcrR family transcriptional regulator [Arenicella chitinivorans]GGZ96316.1 TetR family transcriptional regulator [Arenicella chitinivorans]